MPKKKEVESTSLDAKQAKALIDSLLDEFAAKVGNDSAWGITVATFPSGKKILELDRESQTVMPGVILDALQVWETELAKMRASLGDNQHLGNLPNWGSYWNQKQFLVSLLDSLLKRKLPFDESLLARLVFWPTTGTDAISTWSHCLSGIANTVENYAESQELSPRLLEGIGKLTQRIGPSNRDKASRKIAERLQVVVGGGPQIYIEPGEAWSDSALADLEKKKAKAKTAWNDLLLKCQSGGGGKFTPKWKKEVEPLLKSIGFDAFKEHLLRWFPLVDKPRTIPFVRQNPWESDQDHLIRPQHVELLRGLVWCAGLQEDTEFARALAKLALSSYRKVPGKGPRLVSLGNACITSLGMMPGLSPIGQLAILKVKVKFGTAQKEIEKAFNAAAARESLPRDEIEEMAVPSYGLEEVGVLRETFDEYQAEVIVDGSAASLRWLKEGKLLKSIPAAVKKAHPEEFKELQGSLKDINAMLPAQRERIDSLFLAQKSWPLPIWRERYLDHPLLGTIARRLIWSFTSKGKNLDGIWFDGKLIHADGKPLTLKEDATVSLWHPIGHPTEEILHWREWFEKHEVVQPFKQAHREIYLLTDAERRTGTYSNRFAAHILKQHQFNALCLARGWKNKLRLMVDDTYPPAHRSLPLWNLRAEFWIEGAGTEYGQDTNESGTYLYLTTDQVRFYNLEAPQLHAHAGGGGYGSWNQETDDPVSLDTIPPLVLSEIMRDVDLFVGVASVGNDPNWNDGGPRGQHRDYWQSYSFGELSATAQTRKTLLERLIPRLKIAERCSFEDRFLRVRGDIRTYKIHLGSGNILMLPNDQYLCIVAKQTVAGAERVFLPFEGDNTLSIILSKAFLLAEDKKITDPTITSQLGK